MQYLYILTSTPKDNYYEQFLLSVVSLKLIMPNAHVILLCDSKTKNTLVDKRCEYEKYITKIISVKVPDTLSQVEVSRWLKTSMRRLIDGDFLFLDSDTIITADLSSIAEKGIQFGACLDCHSLLSGHFNRKLFINNDKKLGFTSHVSDRHFNSGVIFCADNRETQRIFARWHELWLFCRDKNILRDQPSFNMAIYENTSFFTELDGVWNCQIPFNSLPFLANSKVIHYFATNMNFFTSPLIFTSGLIQENIKNTGVIPDTALELLKNPRAAFSPGSRIIADEDMLQVINSDLFGGIVLLRKKMPVIYNSLNRLSSACKSIIKKFMVKTGKKKNSGKYYI